ncbi:EF-P lysine aminoacylase GenX [Marinihelvus fidelis]|uniref:EF-P lysine aminoacylase GenX n=1 Tax=Marinihelvus fidelis TaxID=2613842 RepID=A0A5N0T4Y7_9GAMM|nr:EF-P lysine aminoacylase EpmA [Marinihelvus fidelis]KAA9129848.1 EF-P lysine aminoacylase GenX [Marinihelvus fidelis]
MRSFEPTASTRALRARADVLATIRDFFARRHVMEVETPVLSAAGNSDPGIEQLAGGDRWLRTSPEYAMKRLLAAGSGDIYELGRVFRAGEAGRRHNPEFTLLEWYRLGWPLSRLMDETATLVNACGACFDRQWRVNTLEYGDWLHETTGIDPHRDDVTRLRTAVRDHGIHFDGLAQCDRDTCLDLLVSHVAEAALPTDAMTLVHGYPASQAALARLDGGDPPVALRFELYLGQVELANGYDELTDAAEQRFRFESENRKRQADGQPIRPLDERLLAALASGLPACSGVALGVDRLLMACLDAEAIDQVIAFPAPIA